MKRARALLGALIAINALIIATVIGYAIGSDTGRKSADCDKGLILSVDVTGADQAGNGRTALNLGDCNSIDREAFIAAVEALTGRHPGLTTTTSSTTTTTTPKPAS